MATQKPDAAAPDEAARFAAAYAARFAQHHLAWTEFFVAHMAGLRRGLGNLDDALLLAAIGLGPVGATARQPVRPRRAGAVAAAALPTNAQRLADMTAIPRETVRRRLLAFRDRGWVEQSADGSWRFSLDGDGRPRVAVELAALHGEFLGHLSRLQAAFARLEA